VQAEAPYNLRTLTIKLVPEMEQAPLEIADHWIVARVTRQRFRYLVFETFLPSFQIINTVGLCHGILQFGRVATHMRQCPLCPSRCNCA